MLDANNSSTGLAVEARIATFNFGERIILRNVLLSVGKGEALAILGPSGSGKSTLVRLLAGLLPRRNTERFDGSVRLFGLHPEEYRSTGKLSAMFQDPTLLPHLTVEQNIGLPLEILGFNASDEVAAVVRDVGLEEFRDYLPRDLSGGMRTRTALARAFVSTPELLFLDEPFSALDLGWKENLYRNLQAQRNRFGTTVLMVTHDLEEAVYNSNRILVLRADGVIHEELSVPGVFPREYSFGETVSRHTSLLRQLAQLLSHPIRGELNFV